MTWREFARWFPKTLAAMACGFVAASAIAAISLAVAIATFLYAIRLLGVK